jgi:hypothetical protein
MGEFMIPVFLIIFFSLLSFAGPVFGSEQPIKEIIALVRCAGSMDFDKKELIYSSDANRKAWQSCGIQSEQNEPFFPLYQDCFPAIRFKIDNEIHEKIYDDIYYNLIWIDAIPFRYISIDNKFKKKGDEIISCIMDVKGNKYNVKMLMVNNLLSQYDAVFLLNNFKKRSGFFSVMEKS